MRDIHRRRQGIVITFMVMLLTASSLLDVAAAGPASIRRTEPPGLQQFMSAVARIESGGRYHARNRTSGAYGKYQIMPHSWRGWARRYLGSAHARPTPRNQEIVARAKMTALYGWLRDWRLVAYWWLTGRRETRTWRWSSRSQRYVNRVMFHYGRGMRAAELAVAAAAATAQPTPAESPMASPGADASAALEQAVGSPSAATALTGSGEPPASPSPSPLPTPTPTSVPTPTSAPTPSPLPIVADAVLPSVSPLPSPVAPAGSPQPSPATAAAAPMRFTYQETSRQIRYRGSWIRARFAGYEGGSARYAETSGATATVSFTGRSIAWLGPVGPGRGRARVSVDGRPVRVVSLTAPTLDASRPLFRTSWPVVGPHTLTIEVLPASGGSKVAIDGFEIIR